MTLKEVASTKDLNHLDKTLRELVDAQYNFCLYKCAEKVGQGLLNCKNSCFKDVIVPYKFNNHAARDDEDNQYRKCLSTKFPNIKQDDYIECTNQLQKDRVKILGDYFANVSERILGDLH